MVPRSQTTGQLRKLASAGSKRQSLCYIVMGHLKAQETAKNDQERYRWKMDLIRRLYEGGYRKVGILELFQLIDWLLNLPQALEARCWQDRCCLQCLMPDECRKIEIKVPVHTLGVLKRHRRLGKGAQRRAQQKDAQMLDMLRIAQLTVSLLNYTCERLRIKKRKSGRLDTVFVSDLNVFKKRQWRNWNDGLSASWIHRAWKRCLSNQSVVRTHISGQRTPMSLPHKQQP